LAGGRTARGWSRLELLALDGEQRVRLCWCWRIDSTQWAESGAGIGADRYAVIRVRIDEAAVQRWIAEDDLAQEGAYRRRAESTPCIPILTDEEIDRRRAAAIAHDRGVVKVVSDQIGLDVADRGSGMEDQIGFGRRLPSEPWRIFRRDFRE